MKKILSFVVKFILVLSLGFTVSCQNPIDNQINKSADLEISRSTTTWSAGIYVTAGSYLTYNGKTYKVLISHTTHSGWTPGAPGLWSVFEEVSNAVPVRPVVNFSLTDMKSFLHTVKGDTLSNIYAGQHDLRRTNLTMDGLNISISAGEKLVLKASLDGLSSIDLSDSYNSKVRGFLTLSNGRTIYGTFKTINWSRSSTANITLDVDNINVNGSIKKIGFTFPFIIREMKFTNLSYQVTDSGQTVSPGAFGFPNRTTSFSKHSTPVYLKSNSSNYTQKKVEEDVQSLFEKWRTTYLKKANFANPEGKIGKYVAYGGGVEGVPTNMYPVTTSECHGWGMTILALMDNAKNNTKADFDDMVDYYLQWRSTSLEGILDWQQSSATETTTFDTMTWDEKKGPKVTVQKNHLYTTPSQYIQPVIENGEIIKKAVKIWGGTGGAADGDFDIAYALLLADKQWGSQGKHNYKALALDLIKSIKKFYVASSKDSAHILIATWYQEGDKPADDDSTYWATRGSDLLLTHFYAFKNVTGDSIWDKVINRAENTFVRLQRDSQKGLFSDYYVGDINGNWRIPTEIVQERDTDGAYSWNSCRSPWRVYLSLSFINERSPFFPYSTIHESAIKYNRFVKAQGGPKNIYTGYDIDGSVLEYKDANGNLIVASQEENMAFAAPAFLASVYTNNYSEQEIRANYEHILDDSNLTPPGPGEPYKGYFGESIRLISMIAYSGNWINL